MNILYLGYWSINDGLTQAAIVPHLKVLSTFEQITNIYYLSIERGLWPESHSINISKCKHIPLSSRNIPNTIINKSVDYYTFPKLLKKFIDQNKVDFCIGAGTHAGALLYLACRRNDVPFIVSYFDPHADYMRALKIWKKYDPRHIMLHYWEKQLKKYARAIFAVSKGYGNTLVNEGIDTKRVFVTPCTTDLATFIINDQWRIDIRKQLGWNATDVVGIYVGKFGDIYFDDKAFDLFMELKKVIGDFKVIILSASKKEWLKEKLRHRGFSSEEMFVDLVDHDEVPAYLNASDVAFCLHKPHEYSYAYSPIKNGEYWACGLPVIISENIGDDSFIIKESDSGIILKDISKFDHKKTASKLMELLKRTDRSEIRQLAIRYRNPDVLVKVYTRILEGGVLE